MERSWCGPIRRRWLPQSPAPSTRRAAGPGKPAGVDGCAGELLVAEGFISQQQLHDALREHRRSKERLGSVLARKGLVSEDQLVDILSTEDGLPSVTIEDHGDRPRDASDGPGAHRTQSTTSCR